MAFIFGNSITCASQIPNKLCAGFPFSIVATSFVSFTGHTVNFYKGSNYLPIFSTIAITENNGQEGDIYLYKVTVNVPSEFEYGTDYSIEIQDGYGFYLKKDNITIGNLSGNFMVKSYDGTQFPTRLKINIGNSIHLEGKLFKDNELYTSNLSYEWFKNSQIFSAQNPVIISDIGEYNLKISQAGCTKISNLINILYKITTTKSGNWSDPTVWSFGVLPTNFDDVIIASGHNIIIPDNYTGQISNLLNNGNLIFGQNAALNLTGQ